MGALALPRMQAYADRVGATLIVISEAPQGYSLPEFYLKMNVANILESYDRVLYVDVDVLIHPKAEDVFSIVPGGCFAAVSVEYIFKKVSDEKVNLKNVLGDIQWSNPYFNAGLMLVSAGQKNMFNESDGFIESWEEWRSIDKNSGMNDQSVLNYRLNQSGENLYQLDRKFNFTRAGGDFHKRFSKSFIHYAGLRGNRIEMMTKDDRVLGSWLLRTIYGLIPLLCRVRDKLLFG